LKNHHEGTLSIEAHWLDNTASNQDFI